MTDRRKVKAGFARAAVSTEGLRRTGAFGAERTTKDPVVCNG
jgi:hypothetical protein